LTLVTPAAERVYPIGQTWVELAASDSAGNTATCDVPVTVERPRSLTVVCPAAMQVDAPSDRCGWAGTLSGTGSAACVGELALTSAPLELSVGTSRVDLRTSDDQPVAGACEVDVEVSDVTAPTVHCGAPEALTAADLPALVTPSAADACEVSLTVVDLRCLDPRGDEVACDVASDADGQVSIRATPAGTHTIVWTVIATDASGLEARQPCIVPVTVVGDRDGDGWFDDVDNCPDVPNGQPHDLFGGAQRDLDRDGLGDACDPELDGVIAQGSGGCGAGGGAAAGSLVVLGLAVCRALVRQKRSRCRPFR